MAVPSSAAPLTAAERAARSVFVGNIPYEATEDQLKDIFAQVGPVVSFRLVYDRETGKPKGYGFCEYQDVETAQSAMRNLNNYDFGGRPLRVGVAAGEQNKDEMKSMQQAVGAAIIESPFGDPVEPEKAPEAISKAVASLPPEQMYELMKQMKLCIQNNPNEARNMLLQNPQLAYALLQAQIVMKIVDPQVALAMLYRQSDQIPPLLPTSDPPKPPEPKAQHPKPMDTSPAPGFSPSPNVMASPASMAPNTSVANSMGLPSFGGPGPSMGGPGGRGFPDPRGGGPEPGSRPPLLGAGPDMGGPPRPDPRHSGMEPAHRGMDRMPGMDPRDMRGGPRMDRGGPGMDRGGPGMDRGGPGMDRGGPGMDRGGPGMDRGGPGMDRGGPGMDRGGPGMDRGGPGMDRGGPGMDRGGPGMDRGMPPRGGMDRGMDPRGGMDRDRMDPRGDMRGMDPRGDPRAQHRGPHGPPGGPPVGPPVHMPPQGPPGAGPPGGLQPAGQDKEKAALIMQVLQLTDQQIAMLPADQRQSILILKEQIARSGGQGPM